MDDDALRAAFRAHTEGQAVFSRRMALVIALSAGTGPREIVLRCERLGLCRPGSWRWFCENGGITADHIEQVRADLRAEPEDRA